VSSARNGREAMAIAEEHKGEIDLLASVVTSKPAIEGHFKTGQRAAART
jgi:hypothetical protein